MATPGTLQEPLAQRLGDLLELRVVGAVAGQHVEDGIDVAVLVVDVRADQVAGQLAPEVVELLAQLVEELRHLARPGVLSRNSTFIAVKPGLV